MMREALSKILFPDRWFFGGDTHGVQGDPVRNVMMTAVVGLTAPADRPIRVLEIGSWIGFSALTWAQAIAAFVPQRGSLLCVDPWNSYFGEEDLRSGEKTYVAMDFMGRTGLAYDLFCHNVQFAPSGVKVDHIRGTAADTLPYLERKSFDIVYVDGNHYYDEVRRDLLMSRDLLRDGGVLCGDDLELQVGECDLDKVMQSKSVDCITDDTSGVVFHPGVTLAVHEVLGPVSTCRGFWCARKSGEGFEPMPLDGARMFIPTHFPDGYRQHCQEMLMPQNNAETP